MSGGLDSLRLVLLTLLYHWVDSIEEPATAISGILSVVHDELVYVLGASADRSPSDLNGDKAVHYFICLVYRREFGLINLFVHVRSGKGRYDLSFLEYCNRQVALMYVLKHSAAVGDVAE